MKNSLEILYLPIGVVKPAPNAVRNHSRQQLTKLKSLLTKFGQVKPIIVDSDNVIVDGHAVHEVLRDLDYDQIAVVVVPNRNEAEIRALRLALNRTAEDATWDTEKLRAEFESLLNLSFDLQLTGFDAVEIDMALTIDPLVSNTVEEVAPEDVEPLPGASVTKAGDIWCLGKHIIACGDARDSEWLRQMLGASRATVAFIDPPYNVKIEGFVSGLGKNRHREFAMASGEMERADFVKFLSQSLNALKSCLADGSIAFVCMDWRHTGEVLDAAAMQALELKNLCVWVKSNAGMGTFYRSQHELVFVLKHGHAPHQNNFKLGQYGRTRSNVWNYRGVNSFGKGRDELLRLHPTCKPVAMIADAIRDVSRRGEFVIDSFLGSGSTLIAAEEVGRICIGIEIDPRYVDVAVRRWQKATGRDAMLKATGETFESIAERLKSRTAVDETHAAASSSNHATIAVAPNAVLPADGFADSSSAPATSVVTSDSKEDRRG